MADIKTMCQPNYVDNFNYLCYVLAKPGEMMSRYVLVLIALFLGSCGDGVNSVKLYQYEYVEYVEEQSLLGRRSVVAEDAKIIHASSDSMAYIEAFELFCISQKVYIDMVSMGVGEYLDVPLRFRLYNADGRDITLTNFATRTQQEIEIFDSVMSLDTGIGDAGASE